MKMSQITIYARNTGLEIGLYEKRAEGRATEGRILLRFFRMESGSAAFRFVAETAEGYELYRKIHTVFGEGGKQTLVHKFEGNDGEVVTRLGVERYERSGKAGFAFFVQRGEEEINVPVSGDRFLYAAEFLKHLSLTQAWVGGSRNPEEVSAPEGK